MPCTIQSQNPPALRKTLPPGQQCGCLLSAMPGPCRYSILHYAGLEMRTWRSIGDVSFECPRHTWDLSSSSRKVGPSPSRYPMHKGQEQNKSRNHELTTPKSPSGSPSSQELLNHSRETQHNTSPKADPVSASVERALRPGVRGTSE